MGYDSWISGTLMMDPAIPESELDTIGVGFGDDGQALVRVMISGTPATLGLVNGKVTVIEGNEVGQVVPRYDTGEPVRDAYDLLGEIQLLVEHGRQYGCKWSGALYVQGEDHFDQWRLRVEKGRALTEEPRLVWPNGDEGWLP